MLDLGRQWKQRVKAWREELFHHIYTPVGQVSFSAFTTFTHMTRQQAQQTPSLPYPNGTKWGKCWEYAWFTGDVVLPETCAGQRVVLFSGVGGEQLVYANDKAIGSVDKGHPFVTLTRCAQAGQQFHLQIESYAGHGARLENLGPCPPERRPIPETPQAQCTVGDSAIAVWNEAAYQLLLDVETLDRLLQALPDKSLRAQRVAKALDDFTHIADFELPFDQRQESFLRARDALRAAMSCHNGSTAPLMWIMGQSHIDLAWLWPYEETCHKSVRTYSNQLTLMDEYPDYRFLLCEPALMETLKERDAELWSRTKEAAARGQIFGEGAFYVECDTNMPSGESLIRQLQWGKRWYQENLGIDSQVGWQPDTFGFSAALPQILKKMGVPYFATQKLLRADPEAERFPYQHFYWEGMDGTSVLALSFMKNNAPIDPLSFHQRWEQDRTQQTDIDTMLYPYGYGDGGGGPTRDMLELASRLEDLEGVPRARYGGLREYFEYIEAQKPQNRWVGELYLPWHRGTYTAQRRQKQLMRQVEFALHDAEFLQTLLPHTVQEADKARVTEAWGDLLFSQFHDLAGGVGIARVHAETCDTLTKHLQALREDSSALLAQAFPTQPHQEDSWTAFNPLPFPRTEWVALPDASWRCISLPASCAQPLDSALPQPQDAHAEACGDGTIILENKYIHLILDGAGRIIAATDKQNKTPLMDQGMVMNDWRMYKNVEAVYDAWELSHDWQQNLMEHAISATAVLTMCSPACCEVTVHRAMGQSVSTQIIRLMASSRRVDFVTTVDWQERHKLLKVHFESNVLADQALHEIQFGFVARPTHASNRFAADRYESCNHRYTALCEENRGFAVLNNGCYGCSTDKGEIALTLLRAPLVPDDTCDRGEHHFTYSFYPFAESFAQSGVTRAGYALNSPILLVHGSGEARQGIFCESSSILAETIKPADDGNGVIVRLYESQRMHGQGMLRLPFTADVFACDMAEQQQGEWLGKGTAIPLSLRPFEIKTLRVVAVEAAQQG